jgi:hypothetical protein
MTGTPRLPPREAARRRGPRVPAHAPADLGDVRQARATQVIAVAVAVTVLPWRGRLVGFANGEGRII